VLTHQLPKLCDYLPKDGLAMPYPVAIILGAYFLERKIKIEVGNAGFLWVVEL
jgi:hypothetical protein